MSGPILQPVLPLHLHEVHGVIVHEERDVCQGETTDSADLDKLDFRLVRNPRDVKGDGGEALDGTGAENA
jgi:hypothetical protein